MTDDVKSIDASGFLRLFDRIFPDSYIAPLKAYENNGSGYEFFRAFAAVGERVSSAIANVERGLFAIYATGGAYATGTVTLTRTTVAAEVTVKAGSVFKSSIGNRRFVTTKDNTFGVGIASITVDVRASQPSPQWNLPGPVTGIISGNTTQGWLDEIEFLILDPPYGDATISVSSSALMSGGKHATLDAIGKDRGISRHNTETDDQYRWRVIKLPDVVSLGAVNRALAQLLQPFDLVYTLRETFQHEYQECWDGPSPNAGTPTYAATMPPQPPYVRNQFVYDYRRPGDPLENRWLDSKDYRGAFIVQVPNLPTVTYRGMAYDDTAMTLADHTVTIGDTTGWRAQTAYDTVPSDYIKNGAYDGKDAGKSSFYLRLAQTLDAVKAAGISYGIEVNGVT
jgi:hypothetical protein